MSIGTTRRLSHGQGTALIQDTIIGTTLVKMVFDSGDVCLTNGTRTVDWKGDTYAAVGILGSVGEVEEVSTIEATSIQLTLSGIPTEYINIALNEKYLNNDVYIYFAMFDESYELINAPLLLFRGIMDNMNITLGDHSASVSVECTSRLKDWERLRSSRYNKADQHRRYPLDKGFDFIEVAADHEVIWGKF